MSGAVVLDAGRSAGRSAARWARRVRPPVLAHRWPWSLRAKLLGVVLALVTCACLAVGAGSLVALDGYLQGQLDGQLSAAAARSAHAYAQHGTDAATDDDGGPGPLFVVAPGQGSGTLGALVISSHVTGAAVVDADGDRDALPDASVLAAVPADGTVRTRTVPGLGEYRVVATEVPGGSVVVTGLPLAPVHAAVRRLALVILTTGLAVLLAALALGSWVLRRTLRPLRRVAAAARRVTALPLDKGEVALDVRVPAADTDPRTEVGQVGAALDQLLGHVGAALQARHESEQRVRQFVADASHELRTPLASISGYAEITRPLRPSLPPAVTQALTRIESEGARMRSIVEDLLLLARLDAGRPLQHETVDLARLAVDAVADAHAASPDHEWLLDLPDVPVEVEGDSGRLQQVLANLTSNARTHTPAGTSVTVRVRREHDEIVLEVQDDGPGIPEVLQPLVFERFTRGDASRSRSAGSSGLGLAIVAAVVRAHAGRVDVRSRPRSTCLSVRLPAVQGDDVAPPAALVGAFGSA